MHVTFVYPNFTGRRSADAMQPLAFAVLSALTPGDVTRVLYDERVESVDFSAPTDLVALSIQTFTARRAYEIARCYRASGVPVVAGGIHPTLCTQEALDHVDSVVVGDAEPVWGEVLADARRGALKPVYGGGAPASLRQPIPDRGIFKGKPYAAISLVQVGRGCRYACDFCCVHAASGGAVRSRPASEIVEELMALPRGPVFFVDDNIDADPRSLRELLRALAPLRIRFACQISVDAAFDEELLSLLARSGCMLVFVGFESLEASSLLQMHKRGNLRHPRYREAVERFHRHGIMVSGAFLFGYDGDTPASIERCLAFAREQKLVLAHFNVVVPTPGTPLYDRLKSEGRLLFDSWWLDEAYRYGQCAFRPTAMSPEELARLCFRARLRFNSPISMIRRFLEPRANAAGPGNAKVFWLSNVVSRAEILRKQGMRLG